jgi:hypothetical protein
MTVTRRLLWTAFALAATAAAATGRVDELARDYAADTFGRALLTFAAARTLNGVISAAQGTELSLEPGGIGINLSIGEVLDPINDLIEQFSGVMLVATSSLGLQNVLLRVTAWWGVSAALSIAAALSLIIVWAPPLASLPARMALRVLLIASLLRFAIPALMVFSSLFFETFLAEQHMAATRALEATSEEIEEFNAEAAPPPAEDPSLVDQLGAMLGDTLRTLNARERLENLRRQVSESVEHIIELIVIFAFQTIILPLVFLWGLVALVKAVIARTTQL